MTSIRYAQHIGKPNKWRVTIRICILRAIQLRTGKCHNCIYHINIYSWNKVTFMDPKLGFLRSLMPRHRYSKFNIWFLKVCLFMFNKLMWKVIVHFDVIGGIVDHCWPLLFILSFHYRKLKIEESESHYNCGKFTTKCIYWWWEGIRNCVNNWC